MLKRKAYYEFDVETSISDLNEPLLTTVAKSVYCSAEKLDIPRQQHSCGLDVYRQERWFDNYSRRDI